ncbi:HEPN domain-containing protein [Klebsiella michiganensis]|uniref:HEPN domain-containing protein n=1 Tax=Klebsiella michiganensis TaxID=1134687 RepID=UPI0015EB0402|nr:HEPN domain-containing protein [Klebsiella michiganensis]QMR55613.1 hypothetical protein HV264_12010 [Klebsiella michiganensis]
MIDSDIKKDGERFSYDSLDFDVEISTISSLDDENNYYDFTINYSGRVSDKAANKLTALHRKIIAILKSNFSSAPKILWSDLDSYYSTKAYPLIKDVENLMRKVLTKLLIVKVGYSWEKSSVSPDLKGKAGGSKGRNIESNYLSALDFIDLTNIIFDKYTLVHRDVIFDEIEKACKKGDVTLITDILPRSNWQKYLSEFIECEEQLLINKWSQLYVLRCAIAHNTGFTKGDFEKCAELTKFITEILTNSLKNIKTSTIECTDVNENIDITDSSDSQSVTKSGRGNQYNDLKNLQANIDRISNATARSLDLLENAKLHESIQKLNLPGMVSTNPALKAIIDATNSPTIELLNKNSEIMKSLASMTERYDSIMKNMSHASHYDSILKSIPTVGNYEYLLNSISPESINDEIEIDDSNNSKDDDT